MKKLFFTLVISLSTIIAVNAQEIGQFWMGGSFGFWSSKEYGEKVTSFQLMPEIGYALDDNMGIGVRLGYLSKEGIEIDYDSRGNQYFEKERKNVFVISPFVRWAFLKGHFGGMFLDSGLGYAYLTKDDSDYTEQEFEVGIRPGVAINVSQSVSITGKFGFIGFKHNKQGYGGDYNRYTYTNSFGIDLDMSQFLVGAIVKF